MQHLFISGTGTGKTVSRIFQTLINEFQIPNFVIS